MKVSCRFTIQTCTAGVFLLVVWLLNSGTTQTALHAEVPASTKSLNEVEREKLNGIWREVSNEYRGEAGGPYSLSFWYFADDRVLSWNAKGKPSTREYGRIDLVATSTPKRIDLIRKDMDTVFPGIYEWDGEKIKWCNSGGGISLLEEGQNAVERERPKHFKTARGGRESEYTISILERVAEPKTIPEPKKKP